MLQFAFKGVRALQRERGHLGEGFEPVALKYYTLAEKYCLNKKDHENLIEVFADVLDLDIVELGKR